MIAIDSDINKIVETINWAKDEDDAMFHDTHDQNVRIAELIAKGERPEVDAAEAFETMRICFAADLSAKENRIVKLSEMV